MNKRIIGYDLARALAVFGMVIVNFKIVMGATTKGAPWLVHLVSLLDGRAAATFVVLAGVGLSLLTRSSRDGEDAASLTRDRRTLWRRALFLFILGTLYTPIWPADILHFYGVYLAVAAFLIAAPTRVLWTAAAVLPIAFVALLFLFDYEKSWNWSTLSYEGFWTLDGMVRHIVFNGFHPVVPWLAFLLVGMILGRQEMGSPRCRRRIFLWGVASAIAAEGLSWGLIRSLTPGLPSADQADVRALLGTSPMPPMPLYLIAGAGTACAIIAASVSFGERFGESRWVKPFRATGQLALTLYVAHVVIGMGTLEALGRLSEQTLPVSLLAATLFFASSVVFAHLWRKRYRRGPLEAVMRAMTDPRPCPQAAPRNNGVSPS